MNDLIDRIHSIADELEKEAGARRTKQYITKVQQFNKFAPVQFPTCPLTEYLL